MRPAIDVTDLRFGRLTVLGRHGYVGGKAQSLLWRARCDCGSIHYATSSALRLGRVQSCGCLDKEKRLARNLKHGHAVRGKRHPQYNTWQAMIKRCHLRGSQDWKWYGGRGIKVCDRWRNDFAAYLSDVGERPPGLELDRRDNNGNYEPGNVRWVTHAENVRNSRRWKTDE